MIHPHTELRFVNPDIGYGVFATRLIPRGTVMWTLCELDLRFSPDQVGGMPRPYQDLLYKYAYIRPEGEFVLCWDFARYVNHSCDPTNFAIGNDLEIAVRDVAAGEQITCDYGCGNLTSVLECRCGVPECRGTVRPEDVLTYGAEWDKVAALALPYAASVPQPLRPFIRDTEGFERLLTGQAEMPPVASVYCQRRPRRVAVSG